MSVPTINSEQFGKRISKIYQNWKSATQSNNSLSSVDCFVVAIGSNDTTFAKSISLIIWLCNYELADVLFVFTKDEICVFASKKKISFFRQLKYDTHKLPPLRYFVRDKSDKDSDKINDLLEVIGKCALNKSVGNLPKDSFGGDFVEVWNKAFIAAGFKTVDISVALTHIMAEKDETELNYIKQACTATSTLFEKLLKNTIIEIIDKEKKVKHKRLADMVEENSSNSKYIGEMSADSVDICYNPIIQSGGHYSLKFSETSSQSNLQYDCIICSFGIRYRMYCSNIVRTLLVEPSERLQNMYNSLLVAQQVIIDKLTDGALLSEVYEAGVRQIKSSMPEMLPKLTNNFGFLTGIEFRESCMVINEKATGRATKNMVFNVNIGLNDIEQDSGENKAALFVGDIVVVGEEGPATVLTSHKKQMKNIGIFIKSESSPDEEEDTRMTEEQLYEKPAKRSTAMNNNNNGGISLKERDEKQSLLAQKMNETARNRFLSENTVTEEKKPKTTFVKAYASVEQMPEEVISLHLAVDKERNSLVCPIFGVATVFHISTIKNISQSIEGGYTYLRINFNLQPTSDTSDSVALIREMTFRCSNVRAPGSASAPSVNLNTTFRLIKEVQRQLRAKELEAKDQEGIVHQDKLVLSTSSQNPKIRDVYVRPNILKKRTMGTLEAHTNGFRFNPSHGLKFEFLYSNISKAFFQPCHDELIILVHFVLKNPILVDKKKLSEVQFYSELGEIVSDLAKTSYTNDADELAAEQAEREHKNQMNKLVQSFCERVQALSHKQIEFEIPLKALGFFGNVFRGTSFLQPTCSCLVQLVDWPSFVLELSKVEFAHFERVGDMVGKHFDLVFVLKDYSMKVIVINAVPSSHIDSIRNWLTECDIRYTQGLQSLNWIKILKVAHDDPQNFFDDGGWEFLNESPTRGAGESSTEDEDPDFIPSSSGADSTDVDDNVSESIDDSDEDDSEVDSGQEWSELEEQARQDDVRKQLNSMENGRKRTQEVVHKKSSKKVCRR